nr:hypothetical protein [uncultured Blautia sp.]
MVKKLWNAVVVCAPCRKGWTEGADVTREDDRTGRYLSTGCRRSDLKQAGSGGSLSGEACLSGGKKRQRTII